MQFIQKYIKPTAGSVIATFVIFGLFLFVSKYCNDVFCESVAEVFVALVILLSVPLLIILSLPFLLYAKLNPELYPFTEHLGIRIPDSIFYAAVFITIYLLVNVFIINFNPVVSKFFKKD